MTGQQFNLRWNNHTNNLVQVFADQYERAQLVDVTLSCQGRFLKAHRMVLSACSPYFQEIFEQHEPSGHPIIIMNGFEFEDIAAVVEFMYKGEVMVSEAVMSRLLKAAEGLQIKGLSNVRSKREGQEDQGGQEEGEGEGGKDKEDSNNKEVSGPPRSNAVPLHRRRKRARTASHETTPKRTRAGTNSSPKSEGTPGESSTSRSGHEEEDGLDDLLTAINIEPPLLRDIDATDPGPGSSPEEKVPVVEEVVDHKEVRIPRPPNSFMIFANEWRRQLANQFPNESNKEISVRLGLMWKNLSDELKAKYFTAAKQANDDHKKKFPNYHYNPKEARLRKLWKIQQQQMGHMVTASGHP